MRVTAVALGLALAGVASVDEATPDAPRRPLVFAAASLTDALEEIGAAFEDRSHVRVAFSFAGSNTLSRQILAGAPADVFVSANVECVDDLEQAGLVQSSDRFPLLTNRLVIVVGRGGRVTIREPADLLNVDRLALGDPEAVPAGIYARRWLDARGLWAAARERIVPTLDVRAALAAVATGGAEAAIVYRTDTTLSQDVRVALEIPPGETPGIVYTAALLADAPSPVARTFLEYLRSPEARPVFSRLGFETPDAHR